MVYYRSTNDWIEDFGVIVLRMDTTVSAEDFEYVGNLLEIIFPSMVEVVGAPTTLDTLAVAFDAYDIQHYRCYSNLIVMDPITPDPDTGFDRGWDSLFIHELTHAFHDDLLCDFPFPSWLTEGMAEATRYFVSERVNETSGRDVRARAFDKRMAVYDSYDNAGEQVLGGCCTIAWRIDFDMLYQNAAGALIVPAMAQVAAGQDTPHPLARLTAELRAETAVTPGFLYEAVDRAWSAPVDGVAPPSSWMRSRSVVCPSVRDGEFVALRPAYSRNNVNPQKLGILRFTRTGSKYDFVTPTSGLRYTGVSTVVHEPANNYFWPLVPDLEEGAYLVELESSGDREARTWIMVADPPHVTGLLWEGVAVVFVNESGRPVDIPRGSLAVNGRITARVPGGVIAVPYDGNLGSLTFKRNGRIIGTVTATGQLPRLVVMPVAGEVSPPVVSWTPYHPVRGGTVTVEFRRGYSSLDPDDAGPIEMYLYDGNDIVAGSAAMTVAADDDRLYTADLAIPGDLEWGALVFGAGDSTHEGVCRFSWCGVQWGYEFTTEAAARPGRVGVAIDGTRLVVTFEGAVDLSPFSLRTASDPGGPWTTHTDVPVEQQGNTASWDIGSLIGDGVYVQLLDGESVLLSEFVSPAPTAAGLVPRLPIPNPSNGVVRWPFEVTAPTSATFGVYDVAGRRVFESGSTPLSAGVEVFQWDSSIDNRRSPSGVYFLKVDGAGETFTRKIVIVR